MVLILNIVFNNKYLLLRINLLTHKNKDIFQHSEEIENENKTLQKFNAFSYGTEKLLTYPVIFLRASEFFPR